MKKRHTKRTGDTGLYLLCMLRAALIACIVTAALMLALALLLKWELFSMEVLAISNTILKTLCAALSGLLYAGFSEGKSTVYAGASGIVYILLSNLVFRLIEQDFTLRLSILSDIALAFIAAFAAALIRNYLNSRRENRTLST